MQITIFRLISITALTMLMMASGCSKGQSAPATASSGLNSDAKTLKNKVAPTSKSIESGKRLYDRLCADCHGVAGDGVSELATILRESGNIPPSNLIDDKWDRGATDGEIFTVIRDGSGSNMAMKGLNGKPGIVDEDIWNLVNYIHSLHK